MYKLTIASGMYGRICLLPTMLSLFLKEIKKKNHITNVFNSLYGIQLNSLFPHKVTFTSPVFICIIFKKTHYLVYGTKFKAHSNVHRNHLHRVPISRDEIDITDQT